jgi:malonyl CoA-acyl carrier protein transacylase
MPFKLEELIALAPEAGELLAVLSKALKKDADGKVRVTKAEAKEIKKLVTTFALHLAKEAID